MKDYEVWIWTQGGETELQGIFNAGSFAEACLICITGLGYDLSKYNESDNSYPGILFYDNEIE